MQNKDSKPPTQNSGNKPPPRPPKSTAIAFGPDDDDDARGKNSKKETVRINLPPKPSAAPTIKLPTLPVAQSAFDAVRLTKKPDIAALAPAASGHTRAPNRNVELGMVLAAVVLLNGMLYFLCRL